MNCIWEIAGLKIGQTPAKPLVFLSPSSWTVVCNPWPNAFLLTNDKIVFSSCFILWELFSRNPSGIVLVHWHQLMDPHYKVLSKLLLEVLCHCSFDVFFWHESTALWHSRALTLLLNTAILWNPPRPSTTIKRKHAHERCHHVTGWCLSTCEPYCPGCAMFHLLEDVRLPFILPGPFAMWLPMCSGCSNTLGSSLLRAHIGWCLNGIPASGSVGTIS